MFWFLLGWGSDMDLISDRDEWRGLSPSLSLTFSLSLYPMSPLQTTSIKSIEIVMKPGAESGLTWMGWTNTWSGKYICQQLTANWQHHTWHRASLIAESCQLNFSIFLVLCEWCFILMGRATMLMLRQCDFPFPSPCICWGMFDFGNSWCAHPHWVSFE